MLVSLGPLPSNSVTIWVAYARSVLTGPDRDPNLDDAYLPPHIIGTFERFLDEWEEAAQADEVFRWSGAVDPAEVAGLAGSWFRLAQYLAGEAEARGESLMPSGGEEFYRAALAAMIDVVETTAADDDDFARMLREEWPGFGSAR